MPTSRTYDDDPSSNVTVDWEVCDWKLENILELLVIWYVILESMIHLKNKERRHILVTESTIVVIKLDNSSDFWYCENLANSFAKIWTDGAKVLDAMWADGTLLFLY